MVEYSLDSQGPSRNERAVDGQDVNEPKRPADTMERIKLMV